MVGGAAASPTRDLSAEITAFTRRSSRRYNRSRTSLRDLFSDLYSYALALGCVVALAASFVAGLQGEIISRGTAGRVTVSGHWPLIPAPVLWALLVYAALAAVMTLSRRLGPITVQGPEGQWWLPLPVDRRPMVLPPFLRRCIVGGVASGAAFLPFSVLTSVERSFPGHLLASATFGAVGVVAIALAGLMQLEIMSHRAGRLASAAALVPCAVLPCVAASPWPLAIAVLAAVLLLGIVGSRAGQVRGADLIRGGAVAGHAASSLFFMDTNELFRSLHGAGQRGDARRAARFYAKPARGPFGALVRADIVAFVRLHPSLTVPVVWLGVIIAVLLVDYGLPALAQIAVIAIAGCAVASSAGTVARRTVLVPGLDTLLPVPLAFIRASRTLMPALALSLWMACLGGVLVLLGVAGPALILLGALAGIGMGAGAVRGAARPVSDWSVPPVETPFGPLPQAQLVTLFHGLDVTMLALAPVLVSVYVGGVHPVTVMVQGLISAGALAAVLFRSR
ncbi:hypothetical protein HNO81_08795 [Pseudarthrobacter sp. C4D7]|nr:hypothetical protein [Pseudarthrobacter sp. C4D7]